MTSAEQGRPHYFGTDGGACYAVLHEPHGSRQSTAVLFVAPFGWEDTCSYRGRRSWAVSLAQEGFPTLRFDLPGTGDSAGMPESPGLVDTWLNAIAAASVELRRVTGCTRVAAIGLGLGGLLACVASARAAEIDELVLWAVPGQGRPIIRELKAFARLGASGVAADTAPAPDGALAINGYLLAAETAASINGLCVRRGAASRIQRALLIERDGLPVDGALRTALACGGTDVTVATGVGYGALMAEPQDSVPPWEVISSVSAWLAAASDRSGRPAAAALPTAATVTNTGLRERLLTLDRNGHLPAVLTEPAGQSQPICAVLLNAGVTRRIGPNRMWVETARRWAARGVPTVRLDLDGIGDSGGPDKFPFETPVLYEARYGEQIRRALGALVERGLPRRFLLLGLCSGAYWSFQVGQVDDRVAAVVLLNPPALVFDPFLQKVSASGYMRRLAGTAAWRRIFRGEVPWADVRAVGGAVIRRVVTAPGRVPRRARARHRARVTGGDQLDLELDRLRDRDAAALLVFSAGELLRERYAREGRFRRLDRWPNLRLCLLDGPVNAHTMQPLVLQEQVRGLVDGTLDALLEPTEAGVAVMPVDGPQADAIALP